MMLFSLLFFLTLVSICFHCEEESSSDILLTSPLAFSGSEMDLKRYEGELTKLCFLCYPLGLKYGVFIIKYSFILILII